MKVALDWIGVPGGTCLFGDGRRRVSVPDLEWTQTLVTGRHVEDQDDDLPLVCVTFAEASEVARDLGGRLPSSIEWEWMASGNARDFPWGNAPWDATRANLLPANVGVRTVVGRYADGATPDGLLDVAGNVWEWTSTPVFAGGRVIRGGSYASQPLYARCTFLNAAPEELRSRGIGLRVVRE
ncbi:MAG: formylglycine-generating enzyme family protein [Actinomycetota bacterium]|nr:formylglycine-generating enzyme family protein [Actinomycetota bacterium]